MHFLHFAVAGIHVTHTYLLDLIKKHTEDNELNCGNADQTLCLLLDEGAFVVTTNQDVEQVRIGVMFSLVTTFPDTTNNRSNFSIFMARK